MSKFVRYWTVTLLSLLAVATQQVLGSESGSNPSSSNSRSITAEQNALNLYKQQEYTAAANAFEGIIRTSSPNASLYYYAALANLQSGKKARADQLFKYIDNNFPGTTEATYAHKALRYKQPSLQNNSQESDLPESIKNLLPTDMQALLKTESGKQMVQEALKEHAEQIQMIRNAEKQDNLEKPTSSPSAKAGANTAYLEHPFTAQDIARDGAGGIDQGRNPNCWFEASISALAQLPRGQRLLADTIRSRQGNHYVVRFHNDGVEYTVSREDLIRNNINDKALWASLIECAEIKKFPQNTGANGVDNDQSRLEIGLGCITGRNAEVISPGNCDIEELSSFIGSAIKSQNPIVAATFGAAQLAIMPQILVPSHAYTVIDFEPSRNIVTIRNPHGRKSRMFQLSRDSQGIEFQQFGDGVIKIGLSTFQKYFHAVARSFI